MPDIQTHAQNLIEKIFKDVSCDSVSDQDIRALIEGELSGFLPEERLAILEALGERVSSQQRHASESDAISDEASRLMSRFLGRSFEGEGLSQEEIFNKFSLSLNSLFDSLNRIMAVINQTLLGEQEELATIRKIIGSNIDGEGNYESISDYLERIQKSFLVAHTSFQEASSELLGQILGEFDPEHLSKSLPSGLKFGALRKAELFDVYTEKYSKMKRWYESGQYKERLLRDFESRCHRENIFRKNS